MLKPNLLNTGRLRQFPSQKCRRNLSMISAGFHVLSILTHILGKPKSLPACWTYTMQAKPVEWLEWSPNNAGFEVVTELGAIPRSLWKRDLSGSLWQSQDLGWRGNSGCVFRILKHEHVQKFKTDKINLFFSKDVPQFIENHQIWAITHKRSSAAVVTAMIPPHFKPSKSLNQLGTLKGDWLAKCSWC